MRTRSIFLAGIFVWLISPGGSWSQESAVPIEFVEIRDVIPTIVLEPRYSIQHNFIGKRIDGYHTDKVYLSRVATVELLEVQKELLELGLSLKIYDAYRPQRAVNHFIEWAKDLEDTAVKTEFYPDVAKKDLFSEGYISERSSHTRGSTLDLTIVPYPAPPQEPWTKDRQRACTLPADERSHDNSLDMGTGYDCFDMRSWTADDRVGARQRAHRLLLKSLMEKHGFRNYAKEWWHFTLVNEPFPDTYFDFPIE